MAEPYRRAIPWRPVSSSSSSKNSNPRTVDPFLVSMPPKVSPPAPMFASLVCAPGSVTAQFVGPDRAAVVAAAESEFEELQRRLLDPEPPRLSRGDCDDWIATVRHTRGALR
jgi:hypothetical protein